MPTTIELQFDAAAHMQDRLVAELNEQGIARFLQGKGVLKAYVEATQWTPDRRDRLIDWLRAHGLPRFKVKAIADENWNAKWEASIQPVVAGTFLVKPSWAEASSAHADKTVLEIDPKMSFGTGQHASTRLALCLLPDLVRPGARVLDAGTGTGILSIAAVKQGAETVLAFDVDPRTQDNARENFRRNDVEDQVALRVGTLAETPESGFDVILANIHRAVLIEMLPTLAGKLHPGGGIALAGLLQSDRDAMLEAAADAHPFQIVRECTEDEWWAVSLKKERGTRKQNGIS